MKISHKVLQRSGLCTNVVTQDHKPTRTELSVPLPTDFPALPLLPSLEGAACANSHPGANWDDNPTGGRPTTKGPKAAARRRAIHICQTQCPVRDKCLALGHREDAALEIDSVKAWGIFGGMTVSQREAIRIGAVA